MTHLLTTFEYDTLKYKIINHENEDYFDIEKRILNFTEETIKKLEHLNKEKKFVKIFRKRITFQNYVGVLKVGNISIEILPKFLAKNKSGNKILSDENKEFQEIKEKVTKNLLYMLKKSKTLTFKEIDYATLDYTKEFFEIYIKLFAKRLLKLLKVKHNKEYIKHQEELKFLKEKIEICKYGRNPAKFHKIPCIYHERSMNTLINKTLKFTTFLMSRLTNDRENYKLLKRVNSHLDPVDLEFVKPELIKGIKFNRLNIEFKPFINFCKKFLQGCSFTLQASKLEFFSLLIPMERLFENFIGRIIKKNYESIVPSDLMNIPILQNKIGCLVSREDKEFFKLKPDITMERHEKAILDTKYKILDIDQKYAHKVSPQDIYQMYAYCNEFGANRCLLIYPEGLNGKITNVNWKLGVQKKIDLFVRTISLAYDLTSDEGFNSFIDELKGIITCLA